MLTLVLCVIVVALAFEFINGFHDTANAIATSVATKVLTPGQAIILSTVFNLVGALAGVAVAKTIGQGLVDVKFVSSVTVLSALAAGILCDSTRLSSTIAINADRARRRFLAKDCPVLAPVRRAPPAAETVPGQGRFV